jgi:hypothetical protein
MLAVEVGETNLVVMQGEAQEQEMEAEVIQMVSLQQLLIVDQEAEVRVVLTPVLVDQDRQE